MGCLRSRDLRHFHCHQRDGKAIELLKCQDYFLAIKKSSTKRSPFVIEWACALWRLVTAEDLTYFVGFKMKVKTHNVSVLDVVYIVMYVV